MIMRIGGNASVINVDESNAFYNICNRDNLNMNIGNVMCINTSGILCLTYTDKVTTNVRNIGGGTEKPNVNLNIGHDIVIKEIEINIKVKEQEIDGRIKELEIGGRNKEIEMNMGVKELAIGGGINEDL